MDSRFGAGREDDTTSGWARGEGGEDTQQNKLELPREGEQNKLALLGARGAQRPEVVVVVCVCEGGGRELPRKGRKPKMI